MIFLTRGLRALCLSLILASALLLPASAQEVATGEVMAETELKAVTYDALFFYARVEDVRNTEEIIPPSDPAFIPQLGPEQKRIRQEVALHYLNGSKEGEKSILASTFENQPRDLLVKKGDKVVVQQNISDGVVTDTMIVDFSRTTQTWIFIVLFALIVLVYAGRKGVSSILGFISTFAILFLVFVPGIVAGWNPVFLAVVCSILITFLVHFFVGGLSAKSISSTIGTAGGTMIAGILGLVAAHFAHLTGLSSEDARNLFAAIPTYDFNGIFLASIIIGSLGAVMDVGISISSAMKEVKEISPNATFSQLYRSGVAVGKDVLGTMSNTLILAYIGTALPLILLLHSYDNLAMSFDYDFIVDEIVRSIAGSLGLLTAIPITAYFSALIESRPAKGTSKKILTD